MPPTSRKSISKAVWRIPDIPGASKAQVSSYWMDESGKMWYSGPKSGKTKSRKSNQSENVPPKPAQAAKRLFPDETSSNISKPYLALADMTVSMVDECYGDVMPTGASEQRQRRKAAGQDSLELISIDSQHIHENVGVAWSAFWQWIDSSSLVTLARLGVVVLLLVCVLEVSLRCVGVRRLSYRDETAQLYDIDIEAKPEFAETARFEGIIGLVANSVSASTYTATVDTSRLSRHRPGTFNAVCASVRGSKPGSYASTCVTPSAFDPPAAFTAFTAAGLRTDRYVFTVVAWNDSGKKVVLHDEFGIISNSGLSVETTVSAAPGMHPPTHV